MLILIVRLLVLPRLLPNHSLMLLVPSPKLYPSPLRRLLRRIPLRRVPVPLPAGSLPRPLVMLPLIFV